MTIGLYLVLGSPIKSQLLDEIHFLVLLYSRLMLINKVFVLSEEAILLFSEETVLVFSQSHFLVVCPRWGNQLPDHEGTAPPQKMNEFLIRNIKNHFNQAWLGKKQRPAEPTLCRTRRCLIRHECVWADT